MYWAQSATQRGGPAEREDGVRHRLAGGLAALGLALAATTGAAGADPKGETCELECDNGETYEVITSGSGDFTPALVVDSNTVLVPVEFGAFHGVVRNPAGAIVDEFNDPPTPKGQSGKNLKDPVECEFSFFEVSDGSDPEFPAGFTFSATGSVTVRVVPGR